MYILYYKHKCNPWLRLSSFFMENLFRLLPWTTKSCEGFHSKFNGMLYFAHPNMCQFIGVLKNVQKHIYIKIRSSTHIKKIRLKISEEEEFWRQIIKYENNQITRLINYVKTDTFSNQSTIKIYYVLKFVYYMFFF